MGFISDIVSSSVGTLIKDVSTAVKPFITTEGDRLALDIKLQDMQNNVLLKLTEDANIYESEITKRLQADMSSDSWLSKNIRPMTLIFILVMYSLLSISSGFEFKVTQAYIELLGQWGMLIMSFYFGGRTVEKIVASIKGN